MALGNGTRALGSPSELGLHNRQRIVAAVRAHGGLSRSGIARSTGLSKGAVSTIVQDLIDLGLLSERERANDADTRRRSEGLGRPGVVVELNPVYALGVGVEITDARAEALAVDLHGKVRASASRTFRSDEAAETIVATVCLAVREVLAALPSPDAVRGIGVAVPGLVDAARGVSLWIPGLLEWHDVPLRATLQREFAMPVFIDWRAYAAALAEQWYGAGSGRDDFLYLNIGDGIGMGIVVRGELLRGATSMAGMVAHIHKPGPGDDQTCICGNVGCLQTRVTVPALIHRAQRAIADGVLSVLTAPARTRPEALSFDALITAAQAGDKLALNLFEETGEVLGATIADLIHLFNPPLIIIGGALAAAADLLIDPIRRAARRVALTQMYAAVEIVFSGLRPRAAILGAGAMVLRRVLEFDPEVAPETVPARGAPNGKRQEA